MMIWSRTLCVRRGGLAGEDGGVRRWVGGCGGGVGDLLVVRDGTCTLGIRVVGVGPGGSICAGGDVGFRDVSRKRKASRAASSP